MQVLVSPSPSRPTEAYATSSPHHPPSLKQIEQLHKQVEGQRLQIHRLESKVSLGNIGTSKSPAASRNDRAQELHMRQM